MAKILIIDDDSAVRGVLQQILVRAGHEVMAQSDGQQALDVLQSPDTPLPDVIFTDVYMPEMDGIEFLLRLGEVAPDIPAVVVSGGGVVAEAAHVLTDAVHLGAAATLMKPFTPSDVYRTLDQVLPTEE